MANSAGVCTSFKQEVFCGIHAFGTSVVRAGTGADSYKMALYTPTATIGPATTAYTATGEVSSANYSAGGSAVTNGNQPATSGTTAYWTPSANITWSTVSFTTDCALLYNSTQSNKSVCAFTFGSQTVTSGNFTLTMPTNDSTNALLRLS